MSVWWKQDDFLREAKNVHGERYDYSKSIFVRKDRELTITCKIHGGFLQQPKQHVLKKRGCSLCGIKKVADSERKTNEQFIKEAVAIHGNYYDYSKVNYTGSLKKVIIICPKHGEFEQIATQHIGKKRTGCDKCGTDRLRSNKEEFIRKSVAIHGDKYDYSKFVYVDSKTNSVIICPIHGEFLKTPNYHLRGQGCRDCSRFKSKGERKIELVLESNNLNFKKQIYLDDCFRFTKRTKLSFDFGLYKEDELICLIEYDGRQHFESIEWFGGKNALISTQERDLFKDNYCKENNIKLYRINYKQDIEKELDKILKECYN